jgi:hypothetical protein
LLLFSVLYGFWVMALNGVAGDGKVVRELAEQFLALAEKQQATVPLMVGHRIMGVSLLQAGDLAKGRAHLDQASAFYDPAADRPLANRFGTDVGVAILTFRSIGGWLLGYPDAALADADRALKNAREIGEAATLMYALAGTLLTLLHSGNYATATTQFTELVALTDEKGALFWKNLAMGPQGCVLALTGKASDAIQMLTASRSTGSTLWSLDLKEAKALLEELTA